MLELYVFFNNLLLFHFVTELLVIKTADKIFYLSHGYIMLCYEICFYSCLSIKLLQ